MIQLNPKVKRLLKRNDEGRLPIREAIKRARKIGKTHSYMTLWADGAEEALDGEMFWGMEMLRQSYLTAAPGHVLRTEKLTNE